jgi:hypothetical protein
LFSLVSSPSTNAEALRERSRSRSKSSEMFNAERTASVDSVDHIIHVTCDAPGEFFTLAPQGVFGTEDLYANAFLVHRHVYVCSTALHLVNGPCYQPGLTLNSVQTTAGKNFLSPQLQIRVDPRQEFLGARGKSLPFAIRQQYARRISVGA